MAEGEHKRQLNVRVPESLFDAVDARRAPLGLSRDVMVARMLRYALAAPVKGRRTTPTSDTIRRPR